MNKSSDYRRQEFIYKASIHIFGFALYTCWCFPYDIHRSKLKRKSFKCFCFSYDSNRHLLLLHSSQSLVVKSDRHLTMMQYGKHFKHLAKLPLPDFITTFKTCSYFFMLAFFLGGSPHLKEDSLVYNVTDRQRLRTTSTGTVHLRLGVILRNFDKHGVEVT